MIASKQGDRVRIFDFQAEQELYGLQWVLIFIDVAAKEQKSLIWHFADELKYVKHVVKLAINVANDSDRCSDWLHVAFLHQDLFGSLAKLAKLTLR